MSTIGTFTKSENGYAGTVRTLNVNVKVKFLPNEKTSDKSPDFRVPSLDAVDDGATVLTVVAKFPDKTIFEGAAVGFTEKLRGGLVERLDPEGGV